MVTRRFESTGTKPCARVSVRALMAVCSYCEDICTQAVVCVLVMAFAPITFAVETAKVLPKGIFRARLISAQSEKISDNVNENGQLEPFANSLNTSVTVKDLANKDPRVVDLVNALNNIESGLGDNLMGSNLYSNMTLNIRTFIPALEYGATDKLSLGVRFPIVTRKVSANFSAESINNAAYAAAQTGSLSPDLTAALQQFSAQSFDTNMYVKSIFTDKGYDAPASFEKTEMGDMELGGKYNFFNNQIFYATTLVGIRAPTGSTPSMTHIFDKGSGGGAWAMALTTYQEYFPTKHISFGASQKWTHYFPDTAKRAVPKDEYDSLPSLLPQDGQVQKVTRTQGEKVEAELSSKLHFRDSDFTAWTAYQFMAKGADSYNGPGDLYYQGLSTKSEQMSHSAELGVGYSSVNAFRRKEFAVPLQLELMYNNTLAGKNVARLNYVRLDVLVYF